MTPRTDDRDRTRRTVVAQAARLLQEGGPSAVTTRAVADAAGVQAPTLYRLFGDKDGLLEAVAEHVMATFAAAKADEASTAADDDLDPLEDLRRGWRTYVDFGLANPALFVLLADPGRSAESPAAAAGLGVLRARVHRLAEAGRLRVGEDRVVALVHAAGVGAVTTLLAHPADERPEGLDEDLLEAVLARVLDGGEPTTSDPDAVRVAAVTLRAHTDDLTALTGPERRLLAEWLERVSAAR